MQSYLKSEEFIWKDLVVRAELAIRKVREAWRKEHDYPRVLLAWPAEHLKTADGTEVTHIVSFAIPDGMSSFGAAVRMAKETKAYGLLLIEKKDDDLKVILESPHGAMCWTLPIRRHGDVTVLEKEHAAKNAESIGVLWRRGAGQS